MASTVPGRRTRSLVTQRDGSQIRCMHSGHTRLQSEAYASTMKSTQEPFTINCHNTVCILAVPWLPLLEAGPDINVSRGGEATMPLAQVECADRHSRTRTF